MVGLDNAGKATIVKKLNGERIDTTSTVLGFNIRTPAYLGCVSTDSQPYCRIVCARTRPPVSTCK